MVILYGENGGNVTSGPNLSVALSATPASGDTWDGGLSATLSGHTLAVPQVLVYYSAATPAATLQGYDGNSLSPLCNNAVGSAVVRAYNGLPNGEIFTFGSTLPCYRYWAGPSPVVIHAESGWPASSVLTFPQTMNVNGVAMSSTAFAEGISQDGANGYWCDAYYGTQTGNNSADIHVFINGDSSSGYIWGSAGYLSFSSTLSASAHVFVSQNSAGITVTAPQSGPVYGPPQVAWNGILLPFVCHSPDGGDVYYDATSNSEIIVDNTYAVTASQPYTSLSGTYDPGTKAFTYLAGIVAVSADGMSMLGLPSGITVITSGWDPGSICTSGWYNWDDVLYRADGTAVFKYIGAGGVVLFGSGGGFYYLPGGGVVDASNGWPNTYLSYGINYPFSVYIDGVPFSLNSSTFSCGGNDIDSQETYADTTGQHSINLTTSYDASNSSFNGWGSTDSGVSFSIDINGNVSNPSPGHSVSANITSGSPSHGPPKITWNGTTIAFDYTDGAGTDVYVDGTGNTVVIDVQNAVYFSGSSSGATGTFDPVHSSVTFPDGSNVQNFAAQNFQGELLGVASGLEVYFPASGGSVPLVQFSNGAVYGPTNATVYTFTRNDGTYGVKYVGLPSNGVFVMQGTNGIYSSPVYSYASSGGDVTVDCTSTGDWPDSTLYPTPLYVNATGYAQLDGSSVAVAGSGQSQSGTAVYQIAPADGEVDIAWTWDASGFHAAVSGSYGAFASFTGASWDGNLFYGLPDGLVITTSQPPSGPTLGPLQLTWNGVVLSFDPIASSVSGSNPTGADVYRDSEGLGLTATIASDGTVTLRDPTGAQFVGTYSSAAGFDFSGQPTGTPPPGQVTNTPSTFSTGQSQQVQGNFDIVGNFLTLGTWTSGNTSANALSISYVDPTGLNTAALLRFASTRQASDWVWSEAKTDNASTQVLMMKLDHDHKLILHDNTSQNAPGVILDPNPGGVSRFDGPVRIAPQGDLLMGEFIHELTPAP